MVLLKSLKQKFLFILLVPSREEGNIITQYYTPIFPPPPPEVMRGGSVALSG